MSFRNLGLAVAAGAVLLFGGTWAPAAGQGGSGIAMREKVYEKLSRAQKAAEEERWSEAFDALDGVKKIKDLEPYEKAQLYTAYGYIYFVQEKYRESVEAYETVLQQEDLPEALRTSTLYTVAQLQFHVENYEKAISYLEEWMGTATNPGPEPFVFMGQAYYQLGRYREAIEPVERAIAIAAERNQPPRESWYLLLRVFYHEIEDYQKLLEILEILVTQFPKDEYWRHIASVYGEMGDSQRQLAAYEIAHQQGALDTESEMLLLARLRLQAEVPYPAAVLLEEGIEAGVIEGTAENYRLLSQAWVLAREDRSAIDALEIAAGLSDDGELDARLAQSYANLGDWNETVEAARTAVRKGVRDAHEMHIMIGMALYELERLDEARDAFLEARKSPEGRDAATKWITYVEGEARRLADLERSLD